MFVDSAQNSRVLVSSDGSFAYCGLNHLKINSKLLFNSSIFSLSKNSTGETVLEFEMFPGTIAAQSVMYNYTYHQDAESAGEARAANLFKFNSKNAGSKSDVMTNTLSMLNDMTGETAVFPDFIYTFDLVLQAVD